MIGGIRDALVAGGGFAIGAAVVYAYAQIAMIPIAKARAVSDYKEMVRQADAKLDRRRDELEKKFEGMDLFERCVESIEAGGNTDTQICDRFRRVQE